jgi:beta-1,4-mannosyl-glycoprotein beta-1,4-N-acetylglucosaminyltransferase
MIYDCFPFFNELEVLELRLLELDDVVDRFVLAEAPVTHSGKSKPLFYADNRDKFKRWENKIIHVVVDDMPGGTDAWQREKHQRNALMRGLVHALPHDGVILSDVDEIPNSQIIRQWSQIRTPCRFSQIFCYYWINCIGGEWLRSCALTYGSIYRYRNLHNVRYNSEKWNIMSVGGWHFSYLGGIERIVAKLEAFAHQEYNTSFFKDFQHIAKAVSLGLDLFDRSDMCFRFCPLDERFPASVHRNRYKYEPLIYSP